MLRYQILACTIRGKIFKKLYKSKKFKTSAQAWNEELDHIIYQILTIVLNIYLKKMETRLLILQ